MPHSTDPISRLAERVHRRLPAAETIALAAAAAGGDPTALLTLRAEPVALGAGHRGGHASGSDLGRQDAGRAEGRAPTVFEAVAA